MEEKKEKKEEETKTTADERHDTWQQGMNPPWSRA